MWVQIWGATPTNLGGQKRPKFGAISDNFRLRPQFPERIKISSSKENGVINYNLYHVRRKKISKLWFTKFWAAIFRRLWGAALPNFHTRYRMTKAANPHLTGEVSPPTVSNNENPKIGLKFSVLAVITLGPRGITLGNFST